MRKREARALTPNVSVVDDPRVTDRQIALAVHSFGKRAFFESRVCSGSKLDAKGKRRPCAAPIHGKRCRGGREFWWLLVFQGFANEVRGCGTTPQGALNDALRRKYRRREEWRQIRKES